MKDVTEFIASYASADESFIRFEWNGEHAEKFVDNNHAFRNTIREAVLANVSVAPLELIRDLFRAETQYSREAWCIVGNVNVLAESLLRRGGTEYLDDFLEGKYQSFDASLGSSFEIDKSLAESMLKALQERLHQFPQSPKIELWRTGENFFLEWVDPASKQKPKRSGCLSVFLLAFTLIMFAILSAYFPFCILSATRNTIPRGVNRVAKASMFVSLPGITSRLPFSIAS